jgi:hypothetical protein
MTWDPCTNCDLPAVCYIPYGGLDLPLCWYHGITAMVFQMPDHTWRADKLDEVTWWPKEKDDEE